MIESPEQLEISPIRHAISTGLSQSRINGSARGQERPSPRLREGYKSAAPGLKGPGACSFELCEN
jgi:hypothetical protein